MPLIPPATPRSRRRASAGLLLFLLAALAGPAPAAEDSLRIVNRTDGGVRVRLGMAGRGARCEMVYDGGRKVERTFPKSPDYWWWIPRGAAVRIAIASPAAYRAKGKAFFYSETGITYDQFEFTLARPGGGRLAARVTRDDSGRVTLEEGADGPVMTIRPPEAGSF